MIKVANNLQVMCATKEAFFKGNTKEDLVLSELLNQKPKHGLRNALAGGLSGAALGALLGAPTGVGAGPLVVGGGALGAIMGPRLSRAFATPVNEEGAELLKSPELLKLRNDVYKARLARGLGNLGLIAGGGLAGAGAGTLLGGPVGTSVGGLAGLGAGALGVVARELMQGEAGNKYLEDPAAQELISKLKTIADSKVYN